MKKNLGAFTLLVGIAASFLLGRYFDRKSRAPVVETLPASHRSLVYSSGKSLVLLVDGTEVYCGTDLAPKEGVEEYVFRTMELNHVKQFIVCASDTARFGDIVALVGKLKNRGLKMLTISTRPVPSGIRLPLVDSETYLMETQAPNQAPEPTREARGSS